MPDPARRNPARQTEATIFKAVGHPARLQIVHELLEGERCVADLVQLTGLAWSTVSRHLSLLRSARVVTDHKHGLQVFYRLNLPCVARFSECLQEVAEGDDVRFTVTGRDFRH